jgi:transposase-like protein
MKVKEKLLARKMREEDGESVKVIARKLNVSQGTVSRWVRDIQLTEEQQEALATRNPVYSWQVLGPKERSRKARVVRESQQKRGREKVDDGHFVAGCLLYWAEGAKGRNRCKLVYSDPEMMVWWVDFLLAHFECTKSDMVVQINVHLGNGLSVEEVEEFWLTKLGLPKECLRKTMVNRTPSSSSKKGKGKLPYGVCAVSLHRTDVVQQIYGAIQEYVGFERPEWLT